jgi:Family of unknown function (DUF6174)
MSNISSPGQKCFSCTGLVTVLGLFAILFVALSLGGSMLPKYWPSESAAELERIQSDMLMAEARWNSHEISDYDIDIRVFVHLGACNTDFEGKPTTLNVRQGRIVITEEVQKQHLEESCDISRWLPPQAFETVNERLAQANPNETYLSIKFDSEYGFITKYFLTSNSSSSDMHVSYEFSNFRPIIDTATP